MGSRLDPRAVDRALAEWGAPALAAEVRRGERNHAGWLRWLGPDGRRP